MIIVTLFISVVIVTSLSSACRRDFSHHHRGHQLIIASNKSALRGNFQFNRNLQSPAVRSSCVGRQSFNRFKSSHGGQLKGDPRTQGSLLQCQAFGGGAEPVFHVGLAPD